MQFTTGLTAVLSILLTAGAATAAPPAETSAITARIQLEAAIGDNPFAITPHRPTYVLPVTYASDPNEAPSGDSKVELDRVETAFQVSFKVRIAKGLFGHDFLHFGYTQASWWQAYNQALSSPFRETNHEPELMYTRLTDFPFFGWRNRGLVLGLSHQSNGQSGTRSRSWNRLYADFIMERDRWYLSFKPWWRVPEPAKETPDDPAGDDNPDITDYLGHFELSALFHQGRDTYGLLLRNNLDPTENRGAVRLDWTSPITERLRGYVQLFSGYGESLIDYNHYSNRLGFGVMLVNWL